MEKNNNNKEIHPSKWTQCRPTDPEDAGAWSQKEKEKKERKEKQTNRKTSTPMHYLKAETWGDVFSPQSTKVLFVSRSFSCRTEVLPAIQWTRLAQKTEEQNQVERNKQGVLVSPTNLAKHSQSYERFVEATSQLYQLRRVFFLFESKLQADKHLWKHLREHKGNFLSHHVVTEKSTAEKKNGDKTSFYSLNALARERGRRERLTRGGKAGCSLSRSSCLPLSCKHI